MSAQTPWTAGPWLVSVVSKTEVIGPRQRTICRAHRDAPTRSEDETRANANLIAAAPDLYEALDLFVSEYVALVESGDAGFWDAEKEPKVIAARAALSRARGDL